MSLKDAIDRIRMVAGALDDNDPDKEEMLNMEGDYSRLMEWALEKYVSNGSSACAAKDTAEKYKKRERSFSNKADNMRDIIKWIIESAGERKYTGASGTVSIVSVAPKPVITSESALPKEYIKTTKSPDKVAINKAIKEGLVIDGVSLGNGGQTLMIRI